MTCIQDRIKGLNEQVRQFGSCPISNCKIPNPIHFENAEGTNHVNVKLNKKDNDCDSKGFKFPAKRNTIRSINMIIPLQNVPVEENSITIAPKIPPIMNRTLTIIDKSRWESSIQMRPKKTMNTLKYIRLRQEGSMNERPFKRAIVQKCDWAYEDFQTTEMDIDYILQIQNDEYLKVCQTERRRLSEGTDI
ncbi:hypothetical protein CDAR_539341 [Caerostris darwini]|uniref:Uncharacterized protein n=1 Tax=Caerostris darwini TaxID=1538125 RepID=A0AAV4NPA5_9ARAC|nr:hypothetical protein CDAR_539341 [Caerostris darwini]